MALGWVDWGNRDWGLDVAVARISQPNRKVHLTSASFRRKPESIVSERKGFNFNDVASAKIGFRLSPE
jgi:hypothetical protein